MSSDDLGLGATLRAWRDRLRPSAVGLPVGMSRRAIGLRREELSDLAGISVDYLVRLEQGRAGTPSGQVVASLARALQLSRAERDHLYRLAGLQAPPDGAIVDHIPPGMQRVLLRLGETPVAAFSADWRLIWWNRSWAALFGDPSAVAVEERSLIRTRFPVAGAGGRIATLPVVSDDAEATDRAIVADLRRAAARYPNDRRITSLVHRTLAGNARFAELWGDAAIAGHREDRKTIRHPEVGDITVDCDVLNDTDTDIKIVVYTTVPGSEDESKLELTRVVGLQSAHL